MKTFELTRGPVGKTLFFYSLPLIAMNLVQILFSSADITILGIMVDDTAVAAVGACASLISLFVSFFSTFVTGASILVATRAGAKDEAGAQRATGVSFVAGLLFGLPLMAVALIGAKHFLVWINCPLEILDSAVLYSRIYFAGMPMLMISTIAGNTLRAVGDSTKPMVHMMIAGILKIGLNVLFIGVFDLTVEGVALATLLSNTVALILGVSALFKNRSYCRLEYKNFRLRKTELRTIIQIGLPASLGGLAFYIGDLIISSQVNALDQLAIAARSISGQWDGIVQNVGMSIAYACMAMVGQAVGAKDSRRVSQILRKGSLYVTIVDLSIGIILMAFARPLLDLMTDSPEVIALAIPKMALLCLTYFITSIMEVHYFSLNAMQRSKATAVVCFVCGFGIRSAWSFWISPLYPSLVTVHLPIPISALIATVIYIIYYTSTKKYIIPSDTKSSLLK